MVIVVACGLPILYVLSLGPVLRFCSPKDPLGNSRRVPKWIPIAYKPVMHAAIDRPGSAYNRYIAWWIKLGEGAKDEIQAAQSEW